MLHKDIPALQTFLNTQKMKFSIKDFFSICDKIRRNFRIWLHLLKKSLRWITYGIFGKNRKFEDFLIFVETSLITISERFCSDKNAYHWLQITYLSIFSDPLTLEFPQQRLENLFLCEFHGHPEQNPAENWFQCKQQVSRGILGEKAALRQLNFVCKLYESIYQ